MTQRITSIATLDAALRSYSASDMQQLRQALGGAAGGNALSHGEMHQALGRLPQRLRSVVEGMEQMALEGYSSSIFPHQTTLDMAQPSLQRMNDVLQGHGLPRLDNNFLEGVVAAHYGR